MMREAPKKLLVIFLNWQNFIKDHAGVKCGGNYWGGGGGNMLRRGAKLKSKKTFWRIISISNKEIWHDKLQDVIKKYKKFKSSIYYLVEQNPKYKYLRIKTRFPWNKKWKKKII